MPVFARSGRRLQGGASAAAAKARGQSRTLLSAARTAIYRRQTQAGAEPTTAVTIPNVITLMRFLLVPAVIYAMLVGATGWALAGFVLAGVSDAVDGFIARQFHQQSELGAYLDPLADKLLLVSVFVVLGLRGDLPLWLVVAAVSRDALIVGAVLISTVMAMPVEVKPLPVSKANTAIQIVLASVVLFELAFDYHFGGLRAWLVIASGLLTAASAAAYLVAWLRHMSGHGEGESA